MNSGLFYCTEPEMVVCLLSCPYFVLIVTEGYSAHSSGCVVNGYGYLLSFIILTEGYMHSSFLCLVCVQTEFPVVSGDSIQ